MTEAPASTFPEATIEVWTTYRCGCRECGLVAHLPTEEPVTVHIDADCHPEYCHQCAPRYKASGGFDCPNGRQPE